MFGFLKKKLKEAVGKFSKKAEEESKEVAPEELTEEQTSVVEQQVEPVKEIIDTQASEVQEEKIISKDSILKESPAQLIEEELIATDDAVVDEVDEQTDIERGPEALLEDVAEDELAQTADIASVEVEPKPSVEITPSDVEKEAVQEAEMTASAEVKAVARKDLLDDSAKDTTKKKKGFFSKLKERIVKFQLTEESFEEIFWDFELALLENGVAVEVIDKIKSDLHDALTKENVTRKSIEQVMLDTLKESLEDVLDVQTFDLLEKAKAKSPLVICIVGVNGSGKTTTIGKLIKYLQNNDKSVVVAAADTFRAAAIQQLEDELSHDNTSNLIDLEGKLKSFDPNAVEQQDTSGEQKPFADVKSMSSSASEPDDKPAMGGTFNATSEEAHQRLEDDKNRAINKEILSHGGSGATAHGRDLLPDEQKMGDMPSSEELMHDLEEARRAVEEAMGESSEMGPKTQALNAAPMPIDEAGGDLNLSNNNMAQMNSQSQPSPMPLPQPQADPFGQMNQAGPQQQTQSPMPMAPPPLPQQQFNPPAQQQAPMQQPMPQQPQQQTPPPNPMFNLPQQQPQQPFPQAQAPMDNGGMQQPPQGSPPAMGPPPMPPNAPPPMPPFN